ncbi:MAG: DUF2784 domain-containing protein [Gammaproteobacteria bacterium]|nr:DUF2784 domain-containing protein [Gammaproteobacteria bacterium]
MRQSKEAINTLRLNALRVADLSFHVLHAAVILFCVTGWAIPAARGWHLVLVALIALSWFGIGIWRGFGYCLLTDLHWRLKRALGQTELPESYVKYALDRLLRRDLDPGSIDALTARGFYLAALAGLAVNLSVLTGR